MIYICLIDKEMAFQKWVAFNSLDLHELYITNRSFELYRESDPCIIYRTSIRKMFFIEFFDYLTTMHQNGIIEILYSALPSHFKEAINFETDIDKICISKG